MKQSKILDNNTIFKTNTIQLEHFREDILNTQQNIEQSSKDILNSTQFNKEIDLQGNNDSLPILNALEEPENNFQKLSLGDYEPIDFTIYGGTNITTHKNSDKSIQFDKINTENKLDSYTNNEDTYPPIQANNSFSKQDENYSEYNSSLIHSANLKEKLKNIEAENTLLKIEDSNNSQAENSEPELPHSSNYLEKGYNKECSIQIKNKNIIDLVFQPFHEDDSEESVKDEILRKVFSIFPLPEKFDKIDDPFGEELYLTDNISFDNYENLTKMQRRLLLASRIRWANEQAHKNSFAKINTLSAISEISNEHDAFLNAQESKNCLKNTESKTLEYLFSNDNDNLNNLTQIKKEKQNEKFKNEGIIQKEIKEVREAETNKITRKRHVENEKKLTKVKVEVKTEEVKIEKKKLKLENSEKINKDFPKIVTNPTPLITDFSFIEQLVFGTNVTDNSQASNSYREEHKSNIKSQKIIDIISTYESDEILKQVFSILDKSDKKNYKILSANINDQTDKINDSNSLNEMPLKIEIPKRSSLNYEYGFEEQKTDLLFRRKEEDKNIGKTIKDVELYDDNQYKSSIKKTFKMPSNHIEEKYTAINKVENDNEPLWSPSDSGLAAEWNNSGSSSSSLKDDNIFTIDSNHETSAKKANDSHFCVHLPQILSDDYNLNDNFTIDKQLKNSFSDSNDKKTSSPEIIVKSGQTSLCVELPLLINKNQNEMQLEESKKDLKKHSSNLFDDTPKEIIKKLVKEEQITWAQIQKVDKDKLALNEKAEKFSIDQSCLVPDRPLLDICDITNTDNSINDNQRYSELQILPLLSKDNSFSSIHLDMENNEANKNENFEENIKKQSDSVLKWEPLKNFQEFNDKSAEKEPNLQNIQTYKQEYVKKCESSFVQSKKTSQDLNEIEERQKNLRKTSLSEYSSSIIKMYNSEIQEKKTINESNEEFDLKLNNPNNTQLEIEQSHLFNEFEKVKHNTKLQTLKYQNNAQYLIENKPLNIYNDNELKKLKVNKNDNNSQINNVSNKKITNESLENNYYQENVTEVVGNGKYFTVANIGGNYDYDEDIGIPLIVEYPIQTFSTIKWSENSGYSCTIPINSTNKTNTYFIKNIDLLSNEGKQSNMKSKIIVEQSRPIQKCLNNQEKVKIPQIHHKMFMTRNWTSKIDKNNFDDHENIIMKHTNVTEVTFFDNEHSINNNNSEEQLLHTQTSTRINSYSPNEFFNNINNKQLPTNASCKTSTKKNTYYLISKSSKKDNLKEFKKVDNQASNLLAKSENNILKKTEIKDKSIEVKYKDQSVQTSQNSIELLCCRLRVLKTKRKPLYLCNDDAQPSTCISNTSAEKKIHKHEFVVCRNPWHLARKDHCDPGHMYTIRQSTMPVSCKYYYIK